MFKIIKDDGTTMAMIEAPNYIKRQGNGCFALCGAEEAQGIVYGGTVYRLPDHREMEDAETVMLEEVDGGAEIAEAKTVATANAAMTGQVAVAARVFAKTATAIPDDAAPQMAGLFPAWAQVLAAGEHLAGGTIVNDGGTLYRVVGANGVDPMGHQPPHGDGLLAVYRPIDAAHAGTREDPIPWVYGMDCAAGRYYVHAGVIWRCTSSMPACVWAPGSSGVWQWEAAE